MKLSPTLFFQLKEGEIIVWDYNNHQQFIIEKEEFETLLAYSKNKPFATKDKDLQEAGLIGDDFKEWGWGFDALAQIFHFGTRDIFERTSLRPREDFVRDYIHYCETLVKTPLKPPSSKAGKTLSLLPPNLALLKQKDFWHVLKSRKTCRDFYGLPLTLEVFSTLLFASFGFIHEGWEEFKAHNLPEFSKRKASPSGGGLHPIEAYIFVYHVEGLAQGLYHYEAQDHQLTLVEAGEFEEEVIEILAGQYYAKGLSIGIFLTADFEKAWWKYPHSRGYRNVLYDLGHLSQTFLLTATALNLQTWLTGAFHDSSIETLLKLESNYERALFFVGCGHGSGSAIDKEMLKALTTQEDI